MHFWVSIEPNESKDSTDYVVYLVGSVRHSASLLPMNSGRPRESIEMEIVEESSQSFTGMGSELLVGRCSHHSFHIPTHHLVSCCVFLGTAAFVA